MNELIKILKDHEIHYRTANGYLEVLSEWMNRETGYGCEWIDASKWAKRHLLEWLGYQHLSPLGSAVGFDAKAGLTVNFILKGWNRMNDYEKQANEFLKKTGVSFKCEFSKYDTHFVGDTDKRDIYKVTLTRGERSFSFDFGQSLNNSGLKFMNKNTGRVYCVIPTDDYFASLDKGKFTHKSRMRLAAKKLIPFQAASCDKFEKPVAPTAYDILACLQDYNPGTLEDFCDDFGYNLDSKTVEKTYKAAVDEYRNVCAVWNEREVDDLREIN